MKFKLLGILFSTALFISACVDNDFTPEPEPPEEPEIEQEEPEVPEEPDDSVPPQPTGTLPVMYINVYAGDDKAEFNDEIIDKDLDHKNYFNNAEYWIEVPDSLAAIYVNLKAIGSRNEPLSLQIKARGNFTRVAYSKKPYKIKLDKKQDLLGLTPGTSKHYALLAHADDEYAFLRNYTMFYLSNLIGLQWTPSQEPVELVVNGDYRGIYFLTESIRVEKDRVDIAEQKDNETDAELITGGYIIELDNNPATEQIYIEELSFFPDRATRTLMITPSTPETYSVAQRNFITGQINIINELIGTNNDSLWNYLDIDDAVKFYLVHEILSNLEAYSGSTYLYLNRGENEKWHFSPLWDGGNVFNAPLDNFFYNNGQCINQWIPSIRANAIFNKRLKEIWNEFIESNSISSLYTDMAQYVLYIGIASKADHSRWKNEPVPDNQWGSSVANNNRSEIKLQLALERIETKIAWIDTQPDFNSNIL